MEETQKKARVVLVSLRQKRVKAKPKWNECMLRKNFCSLPPLRIQSLSPFYWINLFCQQASRNTPFYIEWSDYVPPYWRFGG